MATTVAQAFREFKSRLEITELQQQTVSTRQQTVRAAIEARLDVLDSFLTGSYSRNTMIAPLSEADIDIFVVLNADYYSPTGQASLLDRVRSVLLERYRTPKISRSGQAVTITFEDFRVDVVPAFYRQDGGYLIPNTQGGTWISTDPKQHVKVSADANAAHNGDLVPLIKMIKGWNRNSGALFRSFHLEVLAWQMLQGVTITDFPSGVRYYFDKGRTLIATQNPDPAGYGGDVGYYLDTTAKVNDAVKTFQTAYERASSAAQLVARSNVQSAIGAWRNLFGSRFPAYG